MLALLLLNNMTAKRKAAKRVQALRVEQRRPASKDPEAACCRTCLNRNTDDLMAIFLDKESEMKRSRELKLVTGLKIRMDDGLSQQICTRCVETMTIAMQFRRTSRKAEKELRSLLSVCDRTCTESIRKSVNLTLRRSMARPKVVTVPRRKVPPNPMKTTKVEKVELNDYSYEICGEEFQNDDVDDDYSVVVKPETNDVTDAVEELQEPQSPPKSKRLPNLTSYKCATCSKEFRMKATYKAHIRFHTNFCVCEVCGKRCRNNNQLQEHKRARHGLYKIHKCAYCEYSSATKEALIIHERRHTGERPYICDHCGATFHRRSNLVQHIAIHLPENNFQCDMCPKRLKSRKFLQIHKYNMHTGKRYGYLCSICEHRFEKPNKVRAHMRRVHGAADDQIGPIARVQL
ncbi:unnamed protein product [Spodoptera littoralis]|uniref:Uncharacterized protein n=1 Tax=Spodoptera littoralis TaxID=7109 RepID=A0A9P0N284_SPOLI|nr:unnamed protein product [Spodoptera littoralis]CAH1641956.1 unnamed protein product [Spodoptera littoralis]